MAIRNILKEDDQRLRKKSRAVTEFNERLWTLLDDMYETMVDEGVGLAAPQVGVLRQAVVIDVGEGKWELVNPEIVSEEGEQCDTEGCLSIPGVWGVTWFSFDFNEPARAETSTLRSNFHTADRHKARPDGSGSAHGTIAPSAREAPGYVRRRCI